MSDPTQATPTIETKTEVVQPSVPTETELLQQQITELQKTMIEMSKVITNQPTRQDIQKEVLQVYKSIKPTIIQEVTPKEDIPQMPKASEFNFENTIIKAFSDFRKAS